MKRHPHCNASKPCWETYGAHQRSFVSQEEINRAAENIFACTLRIHADGDLSDDSLERITDAVYSYRYLCSERWRNIVRQPFDFIAPETKPAAISQPPKRRPTTTVDDLLI
jgi:hypothetical protein